MHLKGFIIYAISIAVIFIYLIIRYVIFANRNINLKYKSLLGYSALLAIIVGFVIGRSILWFSPRILVIEFDKSHHYEYAVFDFKNDLGIRCKYLENRTDSVLYAKKHVYTTGYPKYGYNYEEEETLICPSHGIIQIDDLPKYIFEEAPSTMRVNSSVKQAVSWEINDH